MTLFAVRYTRPPVSGVAMQGEYFVGTFLSEEDANKYLDRIEDAANIEWSEIITLNTPAMDPMDHVG